ncbi:MAG: carbon monoxide dehydrogenase, partial [Gammaproteobacteria bacterium]|nr:carbon monoxide dehydrogenase [Gammaproteobacteria bacterium]
MYPAPIEHYFKPATCAEASRMARDAQGECMFIAGGMSLMQAIKSRMLAPDCLIDLNGISELKGITREDGVIRIGAMTRYRAVVENAAALTPFDAISDAASHVGDRQVRNRGTVG